MRHLLQLTLLAGLVIGSTTTFAADCVPTKTPEQADAILKQGMSTIKAELQNNYNRATEEYNRTVSQQLAAHDSRLAEAKKAYEDEVVRLTDAANPGWREAVDAATVRYNQATEASRSTYLQVADVARAQYDRQTESARAQYNQRAQALVAEYNTSVCAVSGRR